MKYSVAVLLLLSLLASCCRRSIHASVKYEVRDSVSITTQTRYIDTTVHIDSSVSIVRIECDSNNKPQIISNTQTHGRTKIVLTKFDQSTFKIKCEADSLRLVIAYQDSLIRSYRTEKTDTTTVVEQKKGFWASLAEVVRHVIYIIGVGVLFIIAFLFLRR
jgi:hypothetical protein